MLSLVLQMTKRRKVLTGLFLYKWTISEILKISCTRSKCQDKSKVRLRTGHKGTEGEQRSTLSLTSLLEGGAWSTPRPRPLYPATETRYPFCRGLGRPQGQSGRVRNILSPLGFDRRNRSESVHRLSYLGPFPPGILRYIYSF